MSDQFTNDSTVAVQQIIDLVPIVVQTSACARFLWRLYANLGGHIYSHRLPECSYPIAAFDLRQNLNITAEARFGGPTSFSFSPRSFFSLTLHRGAY
ncbi:MAG TPA: hypothetical protein VJ372_17630 [Pyrinomonadaceae bacterium]|nr:hypothetical protein [Pyrinomonadaceae bacterium]